MTAPNLAGFNVHASGNVDGGTGAISNPNNLVSVTVAGAGQYDVVLGSPIDTTQRIIQCLARGTVGVVCVVDTAVAQTDTTFRLLTFLATTGAAANANLDLLVSRVALPPA